ncbi:MAG: peptidyl-prolyl cis-trans isomerase [Deltaproteobacteria bacterium]|nr:peptidyl-prolyl cis-trans isomerase [Deltaproteobacteria bacterium]
MRKLSVVLLVGTIPFLWACSGIEKGKTDRILATVNGQPITEATLEEEAKSLPPYVRPILETPQGRAQFLESLITRDLLMQEALRRGFDRKEEVRERLNMARRSILLEALLKDVTEKAPGLSDDALRKFYEANVDSFRVGDRVRVSHVLFKDRAQAEAMARQSRSGTPFEELMKQASKEGGVTADLGFIERGKFDKTFEAAAFAAPTGSVAGPVRTSYGYHLIQVGEKKPAGLQPFEEVKGQIAADLREQAQRDAFETLLAQVKQKAKVQVVGAPAGEPPPPPGAPAPQPGPADKPAGREQAPAGGPVSPHGGR